jgi:hypothetical protein
VGHDEDNDGVDDACDNCPTYQNVDQANGDGDGIGDACEAPSDSSLLSQMPYFESWMPNSNPAPWTFDSKFKVAQDVVNVNDTNCGVSCGDNALLQMDLSPTYSVETTLTLEANMSGWVGILFAYKPQTGATWECVMYRTQYYRNLELWHRDPGQAFTRVAYQEQIESSNEPPSSERRLRVYANGSTFWCDFENASGAHAQVQSPLSSIQDMSGQVGIRAYDASAHFRSFVVYK